VKLAKVYINTIDQCNMHEYNST